MSTGPLVLPVRDDLRLLVEATREHNPSVAYLAERLIEAYAVHNRLRNSREGEIVAAALIAVDEGVFIEEKAMDQWVARLGGATDSEGNGQAPPEVP
jgi:hypothetical protein